MVSFYETMCLVILILPLARLMKNLKAHGYFNELKHFLSFSDSSQGGQGLSAQDDENGLLLTDLRYYLLFL